jgi:hypothetical protein
MAELALQLIWRDGDKTFLGAKIGQIKNEAPFLPF